LDLEHCRKLNGTAENTDKKTEVYYTKASRKHRLKNWSISNGTAENAARIYGTEGNLMEWKIMDFKQNELAENNGM
jgi:hypothetical protein